MRRYLAAAALAALTVLGSPAHATLMQAVLNGDFNDDPRWDNWTITIDYDTAAGVVSPTNVGGFPGFQFDGVATAIHGIVHNQTQPSAFCDESCLPPGPASFDLTNAQLTIDRTINSYTFDFSGGAISASRIGFDVTFACYFGSGAQCAPDPSAPVGPFDEAWSRSGFFDYGFWNLSAVGVSNNMPHNHGLDTVTPIGAPEPAIWTTMILGFAAAGVMLRRRQGATPRAV